MPEVDDLVKEAANAYRAGRRQEARTKLLRAISLNDQHEQAWMWMSAVADSLEERQICLENVLTLNPGNEQARKGLDAVNRQLAERGGSSPAVPPTPPAPATGPSTPAFEPSNAAVSPFAGDFSVPPAPADQAFDWFSDAEPQADSESFTSGTSVDWVNPNAPAVYGSGQQVDLPSADEYDDWVQGLNLGSGPSTGGSEPPFGDMSFVVDAASPTADTSFDPFASNDALPVSNQPGSFDDAALRRDAGTWDGEDSSPFENDSFLASPRADSATPAPQFGASRTDAADFAPPDEFFAVTEDDNPFGSAFMEEEDTFEEEDDLVFETDDQPDDFAVGRRNDEFAQLRAAAASPSAGHQKKLAADVQGYFRYIPAEIEAAPGGFDRRSLMLLAGIVVLVVLNALSFGYLIF